MLNTLCALFKVMRELLSEMVPGKEAPDDLQLLDELHLVVKQMHVRIQDLIRSVENDEVMCKSLFFKRMQIITSS